MAGSISSGVGLISGLPVQSIINQLIALDSRPITLLQNRSQQVQTQRTAFAELGARLLGLKSTVTRFDEPAFFRAAKATSSDETVLTATAGENASLGSFQFQVKSLVTNHQLISHGFVNSDSQPVGVGELSIEIGHGQLNRPTTLDRLNGGEGVRRGSIQITDSAGVRATIDLTTALSVDDVIETINSRSDIRVKARAEGDHLVLEDAAGGTIGVRDLNGGHAAQDLGIAADGTNGTIVGQRIIYLADGTQLSALNDANGVSIGKLNQDLQLTSGGRTFTIGLRGLLTRNTYLDVLNNGNAVRQGTFRITNRAGQSAEIVIDENVHTLGDVADAIDNAGIDVDVSFGAVKGQLLLTDHSTPVVGPNGGHFKIENVTGFAASDLGILQNTDQASITGSEVYRVSTIGDVIRAINFAVDATDPNDIVRNQDVTARIGSSGLGIELTSASGGAFTIGAGAEGAPAAEQLGLVGESDGGAFAGRDVLAGLNSVLLQSLRGGEGIRLGEIKVTAADGASVNINFSTDQPSTVQDFIDQFNAKTEAGGVGVKARLNPVGNGIVFDDTSGGTGVTRIKDVGSSGQTVADLFGSDLGQVESSAGRLNTGNTQLQYISGATKTADLNNGRGIPAGRFTITAASGASTSINISDIQKTVGDVIAFINATAGGIGITAGINANGDGIEIVDSSTGAGTLKIKDEQGGTTAKRLNLTRDAVTFDQDGETHRRIDGSFEFRVSVDADDTLSDVRQKINALDVDVNATIINDGGGANPFHLVVGSQVTGTRGQVTFDTGDTGLAFDTLVRAQDAVVFFGGGGSENPIVLTSSTNTLSNVIDNVTINLVGTSDTPVDLSVTQDIDRIVNDLKSFVTSYNAALESIAAKTQFDAETNTRGVLFGDSTISIIQSRLRAAVTTRVAEAPAGLDRLVSVGVKVGTGGKLTFDEDRFRQKYTADPEAIETLFTTDKTGLGDKLDKMLDDITRGSNGLIARQDSNLGKQLELFTNRIEALQDLLDRKRSRLQRQFQGLEASLSGLQGAQSSLAAIANLGAR